MSDQPEIETKHRDSFPKFPSLLPLFGRHRRVISEMELSVMVWRILKIADETASVVVREAMMSHWIDSDARGSLACAAATCVVSVGAEQSPSLEGFLAFLIFDGFFRRNSRTETVASSWAATTRCRRGPTELEPAST